MSSIEKKGSGLIVESHDTSSASTDRVQWSEDTRLQSSLGSMYTIDDMTQPDSKEVTLINAMKHLHTVLGDSFLKSLVSSQLSSDEVPGEVLVHLSDQLKLLEHDYQETIILTQGELNTLREQILAGSTLQDKKTAVTTFLTGQQAETVTTDELIEGTNVKESYQELLDQMQDVTFLALKDRITKFVADHNETNDDDEDITIDLDYIHNISVGLSLRYLDHINTFGKEMLGSESEKPGAALSNLISDNGMSRGEFVEIMRTGPLGIDANEVFAVVDGDSEGAGTLAKLEGFMNTMLELSADGVVSDFKDPRRLKMLMDEYVDGAGKELSTLGTFVTYEDELTETGKEVNYSDKSFEKHDATVLSLEGLDTQSQQALSSFVTHYKEAKAGSIRERVGGIKKMVGDFASMLEPLMAEFGGALASLGLDSWFKGLFDGVEDLLISITGSLDTRQQSIANALTSSLDSALASVSGELSQQLIVDGLVTSCLTGKNAISAGKSRGEIRKLYKELPKELRTLKPRQLSDMYLYNASRATGTNYLEHRRKEGGKVLYAPEGTSEADYLKQAMNYFVTATDDKVHTTYDTAQTNKDGTPTRGVGQQLQSYTHGLVGGPRSGEAVAHKILQRVSVATQGSEVAAATTSGLTLDQAQATEWIDGNEGIAFEEESAMFTWTDPDAPEKNQIKTLDQLEGTTLEEKKDAFDTRVGAVIGTSAAVETELPATFDPDTAHSLDNEGIEKLIGEKNQDELNSFGEEIAAMITSRSSGDQYEVGYSKGNKWKYGQLNINYISEDNTRPGEQLALDIFLKRSREEQKEHFSK